jgi:hypothetical protein
MSQLPNRPDKCKETPFISGFTRRLPRYVQSNMAITAKVIKKRLLAPAALRAPELPR